MSPRKLSTRQILERNLSRSLPAGMEELKIWLHDLRSMHNVGAVFRSADAFGVSGLLMSGFTPSPPRTEITKTALGAEEYVEWDRYEHPSQVITRLRSKGYRLLAFEQTTESVPLPELKLTDHTPLCLVFGNEVEGMDENLLQEMDLVAEIPQYGRKHSLNVSVTVGIALYHVLQRHWEHTGGDPSSL